MKPIIRTALTAAIILPLASCGLFSGKHHPKTKTHTTARTVQPVRISNIDRTQGSQELMLHSMGLIGTPYRWGGSSTATGFDCSGMIQFVYKNALDVSLPRTARDMAATSSFSTPAVHPNIPTSASTSATANLSTPQAAAKPSKPKNSPARITPNIISARILSLRNKAYSGILYP